MTPIPYSRRLGIAQILLSGFCFGFLGVFGKHAYARGITPGEFLSLRFLIAGALLFAFYASLSPRRLYLPWRARCICFGLGALGYAVFSSCFFMALKGLSASLTVLLLYMYPVFVAAGAWIFFGESIQRRKWFAIPLVMLGLILLIAGDMQVMNPLALLFGFGSAVFYSIYILVSRRWLVAIDPLTAAAHIQLAAGMCLALIHWRDPARVIEVVTLNWPLLLAVAVVCTIAAMSLFLAGLKHLKSWEVSVLSTAEPIAGIALAMFLMGEMLSVAQALGALAMLAAFVIVAWPTALNK